MSVRLFVGNLSSDTSSDDLHALFSEMGGVESCQLITDHETGRSKGFAFIDMDSIESGSAAKERLNGKELHGHPIKVDDAKPKTGFKNSAGYSGPRQA
jgi:RNA recognition motif-containing protein